MSDHKQHIEKLETYLGRVNDQIKEFEAIARDAKGSISPSFKAKLDDARAKRDRLQAHLAEVKLEDALSWSYSDSGALRFIDEVGKPLDTVIEQLGGEAKKG